MEDLKMKASELNAAIQTLKNYDLVKNFEVNGNVVRFIFKVDYITKVLADKMAFFTDYTVYAVGNHMAIKGWLPECEPDGITVSYGVDGRDNEIETSDNLLVCATRGSFAVNDYLPFVSNERIEKNPFYVKFSDGNKVVKLSVGQNEGESDFYVRLDTPEHNEYLFNSYELDTCISHFKSNYYFIVATMYEIFGLNN